MSPTFRIPTPFSLPVLFFTLVLTLAGLAPAQVTPRFNGEYYLIIEKIEKLQSNGSAVQLYDFDRWSEAQQSTVISLIDLDKQPIHRPLLLGRSRIEKNELVTVHPNYRVTFRDNGGNRLYASGLRVSFSIDARAADQTRRNLYLHAGKLIFDITEKVSFEVHFLTLKVYVLGTKFSLLAEQDQNKKSDSLLTVTVQESQVRVREEKQIEIHGKRKSGFVTETILGQGETKLFRLSDDKAWMKFGNYLRMIDHFRAQLAHSQKEGASGVTLLRDYNNLGLALIKSSRNSTEVIGLYNEAISLARQTGETTWLFTFYSNIGNLFEDQGKLNEALKYYLFALDEYKKTGVTNPNLGKTYYNIALLYKRKGQKEKAIQAFQDARAQYLQAGRQMWMIATGKSSNCKGNETTCPRKKSDKLFKIGIDCPHEKKWQ